MTKIQYKVACQRIEELLKLVDDETSVNDKNFIELDFLSELVADYEEEHFPLQNPSLQEILKLRMFEMDINQVKLSEILNVSPSRISEYLTGKSEPTLTVAREIYKKLNIDAATILGV